MKLNDKCLVCGGSSFTPHYPALMRCLDCGFVTADLRLCADDFKALYSRDYFFGGEYADYVRDRETIQRNFRRRLKTVLQYKSSGVLIEVGCAYGFFLDLAKEHFRVLGWDITQEAVQYATDVVGVPARCKDFLGDDAVAPGSVDVIAMWDVIEHLGRPDLYLERAAELLKEGGYLVLTTGDIESWNARWRKAKWRLIHPPTHIHYFSQKTISRLLERKGFQLISVSYPGFFRSLDQILYSLLALGRENASVLYRLLSSLLPRRAGIYINLFDIMCVVARKEVFGTV